MKKVLVLAALTVSAFIVVPAAAASTLSTTLTKLPGKVRVNSSFQFAAPECVSDGWGFYPYECEEGDLIFRVQRKDASGWRTVYSDSTWVYASNGLRGSDITRIYNWEFRGYKYYGGRVKNRYHRVQVTLVDNFTSTPNPTRTLYFWAKYRA